MLPVSCFFSLAMTHRSIAILVSWQPYQRSWKCQWRYIYTHLMDKRGGCEISKTNLSTGWCSLSMMTTTTFSASFWGRNVELHASNMYSKKGVPSCNNIFSMVSHWVCKTMSIICRLMYSLTFSMRGFTQWRVSWMYWFSSGWHDI